MSILFETIRINGLELKNRMVVSAMVTNFCNEDGTPTEKYLAYHEKKAQGGWGLVITENYAVTPDAGGFKRLPGLWNDALIDSHKELTRRVHQAGGRIVAQIYHAGRETSSAVTGVKPVAPSRLKDPTMPEQPRELSISEIEELAAQFGNCARRVKEAGFDGVEIHGAHGYLVGQFMSPFSNKRFDKYGGTTENRARFALEIVADVRKKCGDDFPILYRMSAMEYVDGGLGIEESKTIARLLEKAGVDCIHCSQGVYASRDTIIPHYIFPKGNFINNAAAVKSAVKIPVIGVGRINDPLIAETILECGKADLVTMARASLADPDMPNKYKSGNAGDIIHCIGCVQGCSGENKKGNSIRCLVNPMTGMEDVYKLETAAIRKKIIVAGGGVSGCEAAIAASRRGHDVRLYESGSHLGGQWVLASIPIGKEEFNSFLVWQQKQLKQLGVNIYLNRTVDHEILLKEKPDVIIIATGSQPLLLPIPGINNKHVVSAHDVLSGKADASGNVVVIGGGLVGAETADHLAQHGCSVSIVEMLPQIVKDGEPAPAEYLKRRLLKHNVDIFTSARVTEIGTDFVSFEKDGNKQTINSIDTVVIAVGVRSNNELTEIAQKITSQVIVIGDAHSVKDGYRNIQEGFYAGLTV